VDECKPLERGGVNPEATVAESGQHEMLGEAVQVDPIKPKLKPPGTKRLKLKYDELLSTFAFKFNLRRYSWVTQDARRKTALLLSPQR